MYDYFLSGICLCFVSTGLRAEICSHAVLAKRYTIYVPEGGSLSLSCDVQHCGDTWTGEWMWTYSSIKNSDRHSLTNVTLSANTTRLFLKILSVNQSDEGSYGCKVTWSQGAIAQGHWMNVNITTAVPTRNMRNLLHRFLVCGCACLCFLVILGLARCLSSEVKTHPPPRAQFTHLPDCTDQLHLAPKPLPRRPIAKKRSTSSDKAPPRREQRTEVVYADISQDALRHQGAIREPIHTTVYSSVKFS